MYVQDRLILLAEDNIEVGDVVCDMLTDEGYHISYCRTAAEAYIALRSIPPALAIIDLQMEYKMAGIQLLKYMRDYKETRGVPAIIYSADGSLLNALRAEIESLDAITVDKPFNIGKLLSLVHELVAREQARGRGGEP